ncbi:response regulator [bacterium C-53]|nr:response regulator [Lachnospiraceae bacterium]NBI03080.1 response regulator [Lachnospiraceae bacterium]RKJ10740.1 response regulator [bacterium C-53]
MSLIYILEDDKNIQEIESYAIKGNGYDVRAFDDTEAFDRGMKEMKPDLLLLDVMLPGEDGLSVLKREIIMETVWGTDFIGESRTVDMHIKTLRKKLKEAGSLIITVRNVAYKLE